ncbi:transglutaminase N-terminal domain-containing protein [Sphingomonas immobilis]|uniref:transglutaminase N-terminal domain-containing protein n=1 Tax=Sphingomonas immobilis TaxID=3063997 RepID=UPI003D66A286
MVRPDADIAWTTDVFGNAVAVTTFSSSTNTLVITSESEVDHKALEWPTFAINPAAHHYPVRTWG